MYLFRKDVYRRSQIQLLNAAKSLLPKAEKFPQIFLVFAAAFNKVFLYC